MVIRRERKSKFVKLFTKTPPDIVCPHFYELILSNGCPYNCSYCYLKLTFRGQTRPTIFTNSWGDIEKELEGIEEGVMNTGELADSLAIPPELLPEAIRYFSKQKKKFLLLTTKSNEIKFFDSYDPTPQVIISFSVNCELASSRFEHGAPPTKDRLKAAQELKKRSWRIRFRIDPIIEDVGLANYRQLCHQIAELDPEMITVGSLRQYPGLFNFSRNAPSKGLIRSSDGRMRYTVQRRLEIYLQISSWLNRQPALCKETKEIWKNLGWEFGGCNCTA